MSQTNILSAPLPLLIDDLLTGGPLDDLLTDGPLGNLLVDGLLDPTLILNVLDGTIVNETIRGTGSDERIYGYSGDDVVYGGAGSDALYGGTGNDRLFGGTGIDLAYGGDGNDTLYGDGGTAVPQGQDLASDGLHGDAGNDTLGQGDGNDVMSGGSGADAFRFRYVDPEVAASGGTARAVTTITDFSHVDDRLLFDVAGLASDTAGASFVDGGAGDGKAGGAASSFFVGAAASSRGQSVMVLTDAAYANSAAALTATQGEATGDMVIYFDQGEGRASLLYADGANAGHVIAVFDNMDSLADLRAAGFTANDFAFI